MVKHIELERLVSAAAVDKQYRQLLLTDPMRASEGYHTDRFRLTREEKAVITNIHTDNYETFVKVVAHWIEQERSPACT